MATRLEATATRLEAIASRLEVIACRFKSWALQEDMEPTEAAAQCFRHFPASGGLTNELDSKPKENHFCCFRSVQYRMTLCCEVGGRFISELTQDGNSTAGLG